jgi:glycosyltransferase involved in cell wall biosynthesis
MDAHATIVIAARNASSTIERAVQSAIIQRNCPILLVDDFSSDDTVGRARSVAGSRLRVVRPTEHRSLGVTRQAGLDAVETPFAVWLDADDEFLPGRVERLVWALRRDNADLATDDIELFDGTSPLFLKHLPIPEFLKQRQPLARLFERNYLQGVGYIGFRTEFARKIGYDPELHGAEDVDFVLRSVAAGARFAFVDEPGYRLYAYPSSMSRRRENQLDMYRRCLLKHDYSSVYRLFQEAGHDRRVSAWALVSMALFRKEFQQALYYIAVAESLITDPLEILEPYGPCPLSERWRLAFFRGTTMLALNSLNDATVWLKEAEAAQPTAEGANNLGVAMAGQGKRAEARELFLRSLERFPEYSDAQANRDSETPSRITLHPLRREPSRTDY